MKKEILKVIIFNFFFIIFFLIILEGILRIFNLSQIQGYKAELYEDKILRLKPNSKGITAGEKFFVDSSGYRIPHLDYEYKKNKKVLFLGDSVTFGIGVKEEDTFVGIYRKNLNSSTVYNLALFGYQIEDYLIQLEEISSLFPVEKIIYILTLNDVYDHANVQTVNYVENEYREGFKQIFNLGFFRKINFYFRDKSYLYTFLKGIIVDPQASWFQNVFNYYEQNKLDFMQSFFSTFNEFATNQKIQSYIFIVPYEFQTRKCNPEVLMPQTRINELTRQINNVYDLTRNFCQYKNPKKLYLNFDPMHLSKEGHKLVFKLISEIINK